MAIHSLDQVYCKFKPYDQVHDPNFDPQDSVRRVVFLPAPKREKGLTAIALPWGDHDGYARRVIKNENRKGNSALCLFYDDRVLSADAYRTLACFNVVAERYDDEFQHLKVAPTEWHATSLGTPIAINTMCTTSLMTNLMTFIVPGGDLAYSLWSGVRTQQIRRDFERQGITLQELQQIWKPLSPIEQAWRITGAEINLEVSAADKVIPPETAYMFAEALDHHDNTINLNVNAFWGHYGTIALKSLVS